MPTDPAQLPNINPAPAQPVNNGFVPQVANDMRFATDHNSLAPHQAPTLPSDQLPTVHPNPFGLSPNSTAMMSKTETTPQAASPEPAATTNVDHQPIWMTPEQVAQLPATPELTAIQSTTSSASSALSQPTSVQTQPSTQPNITPQFTAGSGAPSLANTTTPSPFSTPVTTPQNQQVSSTPPSSQSSPSLPISTYTPPASEQKLQPIANLEHQTTPVHNIAKWGVVLALAGIGVKGLFDGLHFLMVDFPDFQTQLETHYLDATQLDPMIMKTTLVITAAAVSVFFSRQLFKSPTDSKLNLKMVGTFVIGIVCVGVLYYASTINILSVFEQS